MSTALSTLQNTLFNELRRLSSSSLSVSHNTAWNSVFQQELSKMDAMPVATSPGLQSQTLTPNSIFPSSLSPTQSGISVNLSELWNGSQTHAYNQTGHAESSADAVAQDLAIASEDSQKVPQNQYAVYGQIPLGQTVLSGYDGRSFYITNVNGTLFRSAVPVGISPQAVK